MTTLEQLERERQAVLRRLVVGDSNWQVSEKRRNTLEAELAAFSNVPCLTDETVVLRSIEAAENHDPADLSPTRLDLTHQRLTLLPDIMWQLQNLAELVTVPASPRPAS